MSHDTKPSLRFCVERLSHLHMGWANLARAELPAIGIQLKIRWVHACWLKAPARETGQTGP